MATTGAANGWRTLNARRRRALSYLRERPWRYGLFVMAAGTGALWLWRLLVDGDVRINELAVWAGIFFGSGVVTAVRLRNEAMTGPRSDEAPPPGRRLDSQS